MTKAYKLLTYKSQINKLKHFLFIYALYFMQKKLLAFDLQERVINFEGVMRFTNVIANRKPANPNY